MRPCVAMTGDKCDPLLVAGAALAQKGKDIISDLVARTRRELALLARPQPDTATHAVLQRHPEQCRPKRRRGREWKRKKTLGKEKGKWGEGGKQVEEEKEKNEQEDENEKEEKENGKTRGGNGERGNGE